LLDLLPSDALIVLEQESALGQEVEHAWAEAAHHLEVARRLGEEAPAGRRCSSIRRRGESSSPVPADRTRSR